MPSPLTHAPELYEDLLPYWEAFDAVSGSRQILSSGIGYIPFSEITDYLNESDLFSRYERYEFRHVITMIDSVYVKIQHDMMKAQMEKSKTK